ncbi:MAG: hypothetical protein KDE27_16520 [Planctomycetes bacterium]|nr:hypothetical protein [Planctomycetota bacterium]
MTVELDSRTTPPVVDAAPSTCGGCGRTFHGHWQRCMMCGWDPAQPVDATAAAAGRNEPDFHEGVYRGGATLWRFVVSSLVLAPLLWGCIETALAPSRGAGSKTAWWVTAQLFAMLGPLPLLVQLWRRRTVVEVTREGVVRAGELVPFAAIAEVEHRGGSYGEQASLQQFSGGIAETLGPARRVFKLGPLTLVFGLLYYLVVPAVALLLPFHPRVRIEFEHGDGVTLRDPNDARRLARAIRRRLD